jgi:hypothetical protein
MFLYSATSGALLTKIVLVAKDSYLGKYAKESWSKSERKRLYIFKYDKFG